MVFNKEELELIDQLCEAGRMVVDLGLVLASGGNFSARVPGSDRYVITGGGTWLNKLDAAQFALQDLEGTVQGGLIKPSSEWKLHQRIYKVRPDVNCVMHMHPQTVVVMDALGHEIRLLTLDDMAYLQSIGRIGFYANGSDDLGDKAAEQAKEHNCVILANHGCTVMADTVEMTLRRGLLLEQAAKNSFNMLLLGDKTTVFPPGVPWTHQ